LHASIIGDLSLSNRLVKCPRIVTVHHLAHTVIEYMKPTFLNRLRDFSGELGVAQYLESICIRRANMIITTSAHTKKALTSVYKISPDRIRVIYHGVSEKKYDITDLQKQKICAEYGISNRLVVLFVGRLDARKNIPLLLKAFRDVLKKTDAYLLIVGKGDIPRFQKSAVNYGIEKNVIFAGYVDDYVLELFYSICDVFVLPSVLEGFGIVLTEAMAAGKPIVATNAGAIPEVVINGKNGILVECDNSSALAHAILKFICDKKFAAEVGEQNKKYVAEKFSWERAARETERVYEDVIARH
jgi:glycosyltransferase involved in cell wall biosynthesis